MTRLTSLTQDFCVEMLSGGMLSSFYFLKRLPKEFVDVAVAIQARVIRQVTFFHLGYKGTQLSLRTNEDTQATTLFFVCIGKTCHDLLQSVKCMCHG